MKKYIILFTLLLSMQIANAAVFSEIAETHVFAPMDSTQQLVELNMKVKPRTTTESDLGREDVTISNEWSVKHFGENTSEKVARFFYEIWGTSWAGADAATIGRYNASERQVIHIRKDFESTVPTEIGIDATEARFNTAYSKPYTADEGQVYSYLRVSRIQMQVRFYNLSGDAIDHTFMDRTYSSDDVDNGTHVILGGNYLPDDGDSTLLTRVPVTDDSVVLGIRLPKAFMFTGITNKFGISFLGLTCPDNIRVKFWRVSDPTEQIEDMDINNKSELTTIEHSATTTEYLGGIIKTFSSPDSFVADVIGSIQNGIPMQTGQEDWGHVYRLEYNFGGEWKYGETKELVSFDSAEDINFELYFWASQPRFKGTVE
jgi:hypothetical protein